MEQIKIIVADDHSLIRQGICKVLDLEGDLSVVGAAANGNDLLGIMEDRPVDVVLLDINMPGVNGVELTRVLKGKYPEIKVVILTIHDDDSYVFEAYKAGANGYVLKDVDPQELVKAIKMVHSGIPYLHPSVTGKLLGALNRSGDEKSLHQNRYQLLTEREMEVLALLASGHSNRDMAEALFISEKTIKNHISSIFRKLEVKDRTQAAVLAIKDGIV